MSILDDMEEHVNRVTMISLESKIVELKSLMDEIVKHDYKTVSEVKGAINNSIDIITAMIKEKGIK